MRNLNNFPSNKVHGAIRSISDPTLHLPGLHGLMAQDLRRGGLDPATVTLPMLSFAALLTQAIADVRWPNEVEMSIGFNAFFMLPSSGGKSLVFRLLRPPVVAAIREWANANAAKGSEPAFFAEDISIGGLKEQLRDWKSVGLFSDDAGACKELLERALPVLAKLLDGDDMLHSRANGKRIELVGHRLSMLLMEQPGIDGAVKQLLFGRNAKVGAGNRFFCGEAPLPSLDVDYHGVMFRPEVKEAYAERCALLVKLTAEQLLLGGKRPILELSAEAEAFFLNCKKELAACYGSHQSIESFASYISRHPERVLRLSGVLHVHEHGPNGKIQLSTVQAADAIGRWSVEHYVRMTHVPPKPRQVDLDAQHLGAALHHRCVATGALVHELSMLRRQACNLGLTTVRFNRALAELCGQGRMHVATRGRKDFIVAHPMPPLPFWHP